MKVIYDEHHDCYLLEFTEETLKKLGWEVGDTLIWCYEGENICLRKYEDMSTKPTELEAATEKKWQEFFDEIDLDGC